jgi:hypothetical protein
MTYPERPRQLSNGLERVPLTLLDARDERFLANALTGMAYGERTRSQLIARNLGAVVDRHWDIDVSIESVERARELMANGKMSVMALRADGDWLGMSTVMNLPLRRPRSVIAGLLPTRVTRRSEALSEYVSTVGPNITAWMAAPNFASGAMTEVYRDMIDEANGAAWTVEPMHGDERMEQVLWDAGMQRRERARFDDHEVSGIPPVSGLYVIRQSLSHGEEVC